MVRSFIGIVIGTAFLLGMLANHPTTLKAADEACSRNARIANLNFTVKDIDGKDVALSTFMGNVILLNFWATWCSPCRKEVPGFVGLYNTYQSQGLVVLGVSVDDSLPPVQRFAKQFKINYPVLLGHDRIDLQKAFAPIPGYPTTVLIARDGRICFQHTGFAPLEQFEAKIKALL